MLVTLTPSMSRITKVRSFVPPCLETAAPRKTPGPCRLTSRKVPGGAGALSPWVRRGSHTPAAHVRGPACTIRDRDERRARAAFLRLAIWTSCSGCPLRLRAPAAPRRPPVLARMDGGRAPAGRREWPCADRGLARRGGPPHARAPGHFAACASRVGSDRGRRGNYPGRVHQLRPREPGQSHAVWTASATPERRPPRRCPLSRIGLDTSAAAWSP